MNHWLSSRCCCGSKSFARCRASSRLHGIKTKAQTRIEITFPVKHFYFNDFHERLGDDDDDDDGRIDLHFSMFCNIPVLKKSNAAKCATLASCFSRFLPYSAQGTTKISAKRHETLVFFEWNYLFAFLGFAITENCCESNNEHHRRCSEILAKNSVLSIDRQVKWLFTSDELLQTSFDSVSEWNHCPVVQREM